MVSGKYARSLPSRERGLKSVSAHTYQLPCCVAPLAGAWIEIVSEPASIRHVLVAPLAGAWIEISPVAPVWFPAQVAPLAGAWIEMYLELQIWRLLPGRSPRGSVD